MINKDFFQALDDLELEKGISKETFIETLEAALVFAYKKNYGSSAKIDVKLNKEKGTIEVFARKDIVEEITDEENEILLEEALEIDENAKVGEELVMEITPKDFGRIAAQTAKHVIMQRLREYEREAAMNEFVDKENEILTGIVRRTDGQMYYIDLGKGSIEGILLPQDQIRTEKYNPNDRIKVFVKKVRSTSSGPQVVCSRTSPGLVRRLFENEVPEIRQGIVEIKAIAREPGQRSKIAIYTEDPDIDPVGACVGAKGVRVNAIVSELSGEKIDIIPWCEDALEFIARSLSPAEVKYVEGNDVDKKAKVVVADDKLSLAIGREGQNARLAARLTGWKIDVKSLTAFNEENEKAAEQLEEDLEALINLGETEGIDSEEIVADEEILDIATSIDEDVASEDALADEEVSSEEEILSEN